MIRKRKNISVRLKNIVNEKQGRRKVAFESHFSPSLSGSRFCPSQPKVTIFGVCPSAGMIRSIRSVVLNFKLDVFTQG